MELLRTFPAECVKSLHELTNELYPMMTDFVPIMIRLGKYAVCDENGTRLPTEKALGLIYGN